MNSITHSQRYLPHTINTRFYAVKLYRNSCGVRFVCHKYHISKASLMRWNKRFDGSSDSLKDKSCSGKQKLGMKMWDVVH